VDLSTFFPSRYYLHMCLSLKYLEIIIPGLIYPHVSKSN
jgi:hypothetical protein